jgi:1-acyl-sn-glycerol-3-phosphate acyltransferase
MIRGVDGATSPQPASTQPGRWQAPWLWRVAQVLARGVVAVVGRLEVVGDVPDELREGPMILAVNHINPFDPVVLTAATGVRKIRPRIMATGGLFRTPVVGTLMRWAGHIRVDRRTASVGDALGVAAAAVAAGSVVMVYPEGRIGLDPGMWPERGKTGAARLAFASGATVVPVAQWGSHEVMPYTSPKGGMLRGIARAVRHRRVIRVGFGAPVDLSGLAPGVPGSAQRATDRIVDAITDTLKPLRPDEPDTPRHVDPTRPVDLTRLHRRGRAGP